MAWDAGEEIASEKNTAVFKLQVSCKRVKGEIENEKGRPFNCWEIGVVFRLILQVESPVRVFKVCKLPYIGCTRQLYEKHSHLNLQLNY